MSINWHRFSARDWTIIALIAIVVFAAFLAPAAVIRQQQDATERILARFEQNSEERLDQAISVNILTLLCVLQIEEQDRNRAKMRECVEMGFESAPDIEPPPPSAIP